MVDVSPASTTSQSTNVTVTGKAVGSAVVTVTFYDANGEMTVADNSFTVNVINSYSPPSSSGSLSSDSSSSGSAAVTAQPRPVTMAEALAAYNTALAAKGADSAAITPKLNGWYSEISLEIQRALAKKAGEDGVTVRFQINQVQSFQVTARITFDPSEAAGAIALTAYTENPTAVNTAAKFRKWFSNVVAVVSTGQTGGYGQPVEIVVKPDLTDADTENLVFYSYDSKANAYKRVEKPACWIDRNGYLHFTTEYGGEIIISEEPLARK